jgi:hypothetical protein
MATSMLGVEHVPIFIRELHGEYPNKSVYASMKDFSFSVYMLGDFDASGLSKEADAKQQGKSCIGNSLRLGRHL